MRKTVQTSFTSPIQRSKEILQRLSNQTTGKETVILAVSGGTDSTVAASVMAEYGPEYGIEPDAVAHINTGAGIPQSKLVAKTIAEMYDIEFIEQGYRNQRNSLACRVLRNGWPGAYGGHPSELGHGREWANRKDKPMQEVYMMFDGDEIWCSGVRKLESDRRSGNVQSSGIESDKPRQTWVSPIMGWTEQEKIDYMMENELPVSEAYLVLGFSGECTACSFDDAGLLTDIEMLCPELSYALKTLAVWAGMLAVKGELDVDPKQLCWGWEPEDKSKQNEIKTDGNGWVSCSAESCSDRDIPAWIRELPPEQLIDRTDVETYWAEGVNAVSERFK